MRLRLLVISGIGVINFLLPGSLLAAGGPVSVAELDFWLRAGRTSGEIIGEVKQRGLLEPVTEDAQRRLRSNGADAMLLARLSENNLVVGADAAAQARHDMEVLAEKERANRALALQQLQAAQVPPPSSLTSARQASDPAGSGGGAGEPAGGEPPTAAGTPTPTLEVAAFPEPIGSGADGWKFSYVNACRQAAKEHKLVLVDFTGSDWCAPCQRLEQEVFSTSQFREYAAQKLVLVRVDFPKRSLQPKEVKEQNAKLAEAYAVKEYPTLILLNEQGRAVTKLSYGRGGPSVFLARLRAIEAKLKKP